MAFVKSARTSTPVSNSRAQLEKLLTRYGCSSFGAHSDYDTGRIMVAFMVPDSLASGAKKIPVRLEINVFTVAESLYRPLRSGQVWSDSAKQQAERVAWRQLVLWVDAALCAAAAGVQKISEAFLAHTLVRGDDGRVLRMVDHLDAAAPGGNWRALLPSSTGEGR